MSYNVNQIIANTEALLKLRHGEEDLQADAPFEVICAEKDKPFVYRRGKLMVAVNPSGDALNVQAPVAGKEPVFVLGCADVKGDVLTLSAQSFVVLK